MFNIIPRTTIVSNNFNPSLSSSKPARNQGKNGVFSRPTSTGKERDEETGFGYFGARYMDHELMTMWLSVDPLSDKYPSISPYAYCAWNPVKLVDPDGRDWYQSEDGSAVCWRKGNAESFTSNNVKYNRIGETYDKVVDNITYHYNQNDLETIHFSTGTQFQKQSQNDNCKATADAMVKSSGANPMSGRSGEILMANHDANGVATTPTGNLQTGVNRINGYMEIGHAVTVGVDYKQVQQHNFAPSGDGMTDHFVAIVGMTYNCKTGEMTYNFFDPGSKTGNSPSLIIRQQDGFLQGNLASNNNPFKVTTVRKNK